MDAAKKTVAAIENLWAAKFDLDSPKFAVELLQIGAGLDSLFRDDAIVKDWLRESQDMLDGDTPLERIQRDGVGGAQCVREFVDYLNGR